MVHDPFANWYSAELLDSLMCSNCREVHGVHAPCPCSCTSLGEPTRADAVSLPRSTKTGMTGMLSLHDYRKFLSQSAECVNDPVDPRVDKTLKRKNATSNLHLLPQPHRRSLSFSAISTSSRASSPPPLSPSYSHSIISYQSDFDYEVSQASAVLISPSQTPRVDLVSARLTRPRPNRKRLNTFREKLQRNGQIPVRPRTQAQASNQTQTSTHTHPRSQSKSPGHVPSQSLPSSTNLESSMLATSQAVATVSHGGASFEILNPRKSLDVTRIVSFIEDVDDCSVLSFDPQTEAPAFRHPYSVDTSCDSMSISQFTDASLPSYYSSPSLYTPSPSLSCSTPKQSLTGISASSPGVHDRLDSLSDASSLQKQHHYWSSARAHRLDSLSASPQRKLEFGLIDTSLSQMQPLATPAGRMDERDSDLASEILHPSDLQTPVSPSPSQPTFHSGDSDIGEPGSPVYANGDWSQVDERDRGVLLDLGPPPPPPSFPQTFHGGDSGPSYSEPPSPYDTYYANTMSSLLPSTPSSGPHYDPYDPIFFDPHIQSVLAAANAENMGLRGHSNRALDDLQRRFGSSVSLGGPGSGPGSGEGHTHKEGRKGSFSQRKKFKKLFSWRS
ncbi:Uncharacterized protein PECH_005993 [Penicillium ucsense]|uniref:Uncharacterized protein n=1 Tax=Penicillium ucsense TaxID=2839758 RepID=A0A8J8W4U3_9EURO|nr:Uncharacterized protein PECM_006484 [Penicillium ucsense]KAF7735957.1 Uncharacterized protein PECH_005993 [Penicillium ucsense]